MDGQAREGRSYRPGLHPPQWLLLLALGFGAVSLAGCAARPARAVHLGHETPPEATPPRPDDPLLAQHRRLVAEGQRASRLLPVLPRSAWQTANNPIVQIPIVPGRATAMPRIAGNPAGRILPFFNPPPPLCPFDPLANPPEKTASLLMVFPEMSWHVCVRDMYRASLWIGPVHMIRGTTGQWEKVIERAGLAEIFVPYHAVNFRPYDLQATFQLDAVGAQDLGATGQLVQLTNEPTAPTVVTEIRERGLAWECGAGPQAVRRAQEFVVWGVADGGNYDNVIEYGFRDDGTITFRLGNTGYNSPPNPVEPHTHNALWYVDPELTPNGTALGESAYWLFHREPSPSTAQNTAADFRALIAVEGARKWDERDMTSLLIEDGADNAFGNGMGFEFSPLQNSLTRHFGFKESWTQNDVYVTRARASELGWIASWAYPDDYLMTYLNGEAAAGEDLAVWIKTAAHHHPNDEDRSSADLGTTATTGVTLMHWSGFRMEPHNLFNANPMGGPVRCGN